MERGGKCEENDILSDESAGGDEAKAIRGACYEDTSHS